MLNRLCKTTLVASMAIFFALVVFNNLTDYGSNAAFVQHVLAMDTIFPNSKLKWRAITDPRLVTLAYWTIIAWEAITAAVLAFAAVKLLAVARDPQRFATAKPFGILGLTFGLLLYGFGITVIGGEWFAMWQSQTWNGLSSAARFILLDGMILVILLSPDP